MPHDPPLSYRTPYDLPDASDGPREDLGHAELPVLGEVSGELRLDRSFHLSLDRQAASLRPAGGLVLRAATLPTVTLRSLDIDLVDGLVHADADALGPFFDRLATVALCSALRQAFGWQPGASAVGPVRERLQRPRRRFSRASVALEQHTRISIDIDGQAVALTLSRPARLRLFGFPLKVSTLRYEFASATVTSTADGVGPVRRGVLRLLAWGATRWLRPKLPPALAQPGYDLFADDRRRDNLEALITHLRGEPKPQPNTAARPGHDLARTGDGDKAGFLGLLSPSKAAILGALASIKISADDVPDATRVLARIPLGPLSRLALCTDRGGEVVLTKTPGTLRLDAPLGVYLFADPFPELAELRLTRIVVDLSRKHEVGLDIETEPPLGPLAKALLAQTLDTEVRPRLPTDRMSAAGLWDDGDDHLLYRHDLGDDRTLAVRTKAGAAVVIRHQEDGLRIEAPAGLEAVWSGVPVPAAQLRRVFYRWEDGAIETDGATDLGEFGRTVASSLMRVRAAPHLPPTLGVRGEPAPALDPALRDQYSVEIAAVSLPLIGSLELRMQPNDALQTTLGPASAYFRSERGLLLLAPDLRLRVLVRSATHDLVTRTMQLDADPAPGQFLTAIASMCAEALLVPLLRKAVPLTPDVGATDRWTLFEGAGVRVSLPPGATLTARRTADALELGASAPIEVDGEGGPLADFTINQLRWIAADDRIVVDSTPPAGPLMAGLVRRVLDRLVPDFVARGLAERLGLPAPRAPEDEPLPTMPALFTRELAHVGPLSLYVDAGAGVTLTVRREGATLKFATPAELIAEKFAARLRIHQLSATFLPFTVNVTSEPGTGELEDHLIAQLARSLCAPLMRMFWPADHTTTAGRDVLLALGADASWGPVELCVPLGGQLEVRLDREAITLRSDEGVFLGGLDWLPDAGVHALRVRFDDGAVDLEAGDVAERFYHEALPVSPTSAAIAARLYRVLVAPHIPAWAQRLGLRVLAPPLPLPNEPTRKLVFDVQLPGDLAHLAVSMDPMDLLEIRASRVEMSFTSELGLHLDLHRLGLRLPVFNARYHMLSGELQIADLGRLENAIAEGLVRRALAAVDDTSAPADEISLIDIVDRFPTDDKGRRILFGDKVVQLLIDPDAVIVLRIGSEGLALTVDPPLQIDGPAVLNFVVGGLRYDFADGEFHLDFKHDGVVSRMLSGLFKNEGEGVLNSLRPALPAPMRKPGYSLASDPDPRATIAALVRTVGGRRKPQDAPTSDGRSN